MTPEEELKQLLGETGGDQTNNKGNNTVIHANTPSPTAEPKKFQPDFWGKAEITELVEPTTTTTTPPNTGTGATTTPPTGTGAAAAGPQQNPQAAAAAQSRVTKNAIETSARTAVATINLTQLTLMRPLLNWRFKKESEKRFGDKLPHAMEMIMGDVQPTDAAEKSLKNRFQKFLNQRDAKVKGLPFTPTEEEDMERAFKSYFEMKNTTMSPEVLLTCTLLSTIGSRAIDVAMWD